MSLLRYISGLFVMSFSYYKAIVVEYYMFEECVDFYIPIVKEIALCAIWSHCYWAGMVWTRLRGIFRKIISRFYYRLKNAPDLKHLTVNAGLIQREAIMFTLFQDRRLSCWKYCLIKNTDIRYRWPALPSVSQALLQYCVFQRSLLSKK